MSWFERGTRRWTGSPAAPVGFGAAEVRCPVSHWREKSGRKQSGWSAAIDKKMSIKLVPLMV